MRKKVFAALLAVCMVVAMLPVSAFAATTEEAAAVPGVAAYGFLWDALNDKSETTVLKGGYKILAGNDWMEQTMYVIFEESLVGSQNLWFQFKTTAKNAEETLTWGCNATGEGNCRAVSFLNMNRETNVQWEQNPITEDKEDEWKTQGLTDGTTVVLTIYQTKAECKDAEAFANDKEAKVLDTIELVLEDGVEIQENNAVVKNITYTVIDDKATWQVVRDRIGEDFGEFVDETTPTTFPRVIVEFDKEHTSKKIYFHVQNGLTIKHFGPYGSWCDFGLGVKVGSSDDYLGLAAGKLDGAKVTITLSWDEAGEDVIATRELTYSKGEPTLTLAADGEVTVGTPNAKGEVALTGTVKFVNEKNARYPVELTITDTKAAGTKTAVKAIVKDGENIDEADFEDGKAAVILQMDGKAAANRKFTVEVQYASTGANEALGMTKTYTIDGSKLVMGDPDDIEVKAEAEAEVGKVNANGEVAATVDNTTVTKAINKAINEAGVNADGAEIDPEKVTVANINIYATAGGKATSTDVTLSKEVLDTMAAKKVENVTVATDVADVTLPSEVLEKKGADDLKLVVAQKDKEFKPEIDAGEDADPVVPEEVYSVELQDKDGKAYTDIKDLKKPITLVFKGGAGKIAAWLEYDANDKVIGVHKISSAETVGADLVVTVDHLTDFALFVADSTIAKIPYAIAKVTPKAEGSLTMYTVEVEGEFDAEKSYYVTAECTVSVNGTNKMLYTIGKVISGEKDTAELMLDSVEDMTKIDFVLTEGSYGIGEFKVVGGKTIK